MPREEVESILINGTVFHKSDRVTMTEPHKAVPFLGTVRCVHPAWMCVIRDDHEMGGGCKGSWKVRDAGPDDRTGIHHYNVKLVLGRYRNPFLQACTRELICHVGKERMPRDQCPHCDGNIYECSCKCPKCSRHLDSCGCERCGFCRHLVSECGCS